MNQEALQIYEIGIPTMRIGDNTYELFCEIKAKNGTFQSVYVQEGGTDVVVEISQEKAITGLFSTEKDKLRQLFDYIEATISPKQGLITYEAESFPKLLALADENGSRYPILQNELHPKKETFLNSILSSLRPPLSLDKALQDQIREHTVSCQHITHEPALPEFAIEEDPFEAFPDPRPKIPLKEQISGAESRQQPEAIHSSPAITDHTR